MEQLERFTRGEPINEEMARVFAQRPEDVSPAAAPARVVEDVERELERGERLALKEMRMSPGWPVLQRLLEKSLHFHRKSVISMSEHDPLGNKDRNANQWAYLNALKTAKDAVGLLVDAEVKALDEESRGVKQ